MGYVNVCLVNGDVSSLVLLDRNCSYMQLVELAMSEFSYDPTRVAVTMKYSLKPDLPPVKISNDSNVLSYMTLRGTEHDLSKYPVIIEVTDVENVQQCVSFPAVTDVSEIVHSGSTLFSLQEIVSDICDAIVEPIESKFEDEVTIVTNPDASHIENGKVFRSKEILKLSLCFYAIRNMFEFLVVRSDKGEYLIKCSQEECVWICRSSKLGKTNLFKIRKVSEGHTCSSTIVLGSHRQMSTSVISSFIQYRYTSPRTIYAPNDICNDMLRTYGVSLNYVKAWRSREKTLKMIRGDPKESYQQLPSYLHMLEQNNPGTVTGLEVDSHNRFKYCFVALGASIKGWLHCRPIIVVDGTYLKGHYGGTLFTACTQDANNSIFVLAFGIGDNENDKSWSWFFEKLRTAYGSRESLCFISDRHNSIKNAIERVYPGTFHGICTYHLLQNLKSYFGKSGHNITQAFNAAARAYTIVEYEYNMEELDNINLKIRDYLNEVGPEKWSRFHMQSNRYSTMTSNIVESVNAVTKSAKNFPIVALLDSMRQTIQSWYCKNRDQANSTFTKLATKYEKVLREMSTNLRTMTVSPANQSIFIVASEGSNFVVNIEQRTCTCRMFQVDQLPCPHTLAVVASIKGDPYDYCSYFYTTQAYVNVYQESVYPAGNPNEWNVTEELQHVVILPPNQKRSSGRPAEKRKRSSSEGNPRTKCGRCKGRGHNRRTCTNLIPLE